MITAELKRVCDQAEQNLRALIPEARNAFLERVKAMEMVDELYRKIPSMTQMSGVSISSLLMSGKGELAKDESNFRWKIQNAISPVVDRLASACRGTISATEAEGVLYMVDKLEGLAKIAKGFNYTVTKYGISLTSCHECALAEAKRWREKVTNDPSVRKAILTAQLEESQNKLEMAKKELASNQSAVEDSKKKITEIFETYQDRVEKVLLDVKLDYQNKLTAIEKAQKLVAEKFAARSSAYELFTGASLFNKRKRESAYHLTEQEYRKACSALQQLEIGLKSFVNVVFKPKFAKIEKQVDDLLSKIDNLNNQIGANQNAIQGYTNAITNIKKELKVG